MAWSFNKGGAAAGAAQPALAPTTAPVAAAAPAVNHAVAPPTAAPAAMPAYQSPAPAAQPAAVAAPVAAAPKRTKRAAAAAAAPVEPQPVAQVAGQQTLAVAGVVAAPAAVATPAPAANALAAPSAYAGGFLGLIIPAAGTRTLMNSIVEGVTAPGEPNLFPTVCLTGGNSGGMLDTDDQNEEGSDDDLPVGRKAINVVVMSYRLIVVAWPEAFKEGGPKRQPKFQGVVPCHEAAIGDLVQEACQRYTFRDRGNNAAYDKFGHPAPTLELLCFDPKAGPFCIRTTGTYDSALNTTNALFAAYAAAPGGAMQPIPVVMEPLTEPRSSKGGKAWNEHFFGIRLNLSDQALIQAFNAFYQTAAADAGLNAAVAEWSKLTLEPQHLEALKGVLALG